MATPMMKCGHAANGQHVLNDGTRNPCCVICAGLDEGAYIVVDTPDLAGRTAKCQYFGHKKPRRRFANDECNYGCQGKDNCECGAIPSSPDLAFFHYNPDKPQDEFFCGCHGWD